MMLPARSGRRSEQDNPEFALLLAVYIVCTVFGSVTAGKFARTVMEKGNRRVGHYEGDK